MCRKFTNNGVARRTARAKTPAKTNAFFLNQENSSGCSDFLLDDTNLTITKPKNPNEAENIPKREIIAANSE